MGSPELGVGWTSRRQTQAGCGRESGTGEERQIESGGGQNEHAEPSAYQPKGDGHYEADSERQDAHQGVGLIRGSLFLPSRELGGLDP